MNDAMTGSGGPVSLMRCRSMSQAVNCIPPRPRNLIPCAISNPPKPCGSRAGCWHGGLTCPSEDFRQIDSMNIHLSPALDSFVSSGIREGLFVSVDAAVEQGLELLRRQKQLKASFSASDEAELLAKLDAGIASLDAGRGIPSSKAFPMLRGQNG